MKQLIEWFFGTALGLNSRGKYRNLADNGEPDEQVFRTLFDTVLTKKIDEANYQSQANAAEITSYLNGDKYTIPANLPVVTLGGGSILTLGETAAIAGIPRRTYTLDAPLPSTQNIIDRVATKFTTPANLPIVIADSAPGNGSVVTSTTIGGVTTYKVFSTGTTGLYIPLAGTNVGIPVTGDIEFQGGERLWSAPTGPLGVVGENFIFDGVIANNKLRTYQIGTGSYSSPQFSALFEQVLTDTIIQAYDSGNYSTVQVSPPFSRLTTVTTGGVSGTVSVNQGSVELRSNAGAGENTLLWDANQLGLKVLGSSFYAHIKSDFITAFTENFQLPNKGGAGGTFAMLDDIMASGGDYQNTFFVDPNGELIGVKGDPLVPYSTIKAAVADATSGDLIIVLPGLYDEYDLAKNGVNYYFYPGAIVQPTFNGGVVAIFTDQTLGGPVNYNIYGQGEFLNNGHSGDDTSALVSSYTGGSINIEAKTITSMEAWGQIGATINVKNATITVEAHCYSGGVVTFENCTFIDVVLLGNYYGNNCTFKAKNCKFIRSAYNTIYSTYIPAFDQTLEKYTIRFHGSDAVHVNIIMELIDCEIINELGGDCLVALDADFNATSGLTVKNCKFHNTDPTKGSILYTDVYALINNTAFDAHNLKFFLDGNTSNVPTRYIDTDLDFPAGIVNQYGPTGFLVEGENAMEFESGAKIWSPGDVSFNSEGYFKPIGAGHFPGTYNNVQRSYSKATPYIYTEKLQNSNFQYRVANYNFDPMTALPTGVPSGVSYETFSYAGWAVNLYDGVDSHTISFSASSGFSIQSPTQPAEINTTHIGLTASGNISLATGNLGYIESTSNGLYMDFEGSPGPFFGIDQYDGFTLETNGLNQDIHLITTAANIILDSNDDIIINAGAFFQVTNAFNGPFLEYDSTNGLIFTDNVTSRGAKYADDYSFNFVARSLIDRGFADNTYLALDSNIAKLNAMELSTGLYSWTAPGMLVTGATTFNISAAAGFIHNTTNPLAPTTTAVSYAGATGLTTPFLGTHAATFLLLNTSSVLVMQNTVPTMAERRSMIFLGVVAHPMGALTGAGPSPDVCINTASQVRAMFKGIRFVNDGVTLYNNSTNLTLANTSGTLYGFGIGFIVNGNTGPDFIDIPVATPTTFQYRTQTGAVEADTTLISPTFYDVAGTKTLNPGGGGTATNQRFYLLQNGVIRAQYGQTVYNNLTDAVAAASTEPFIVAANTRLGTLIGILSVTKNCTDLSNTTTAKFINVSKFGELVGVAGSSSVSTIQNAYNNGGAINPKLLTSTPNGPVSFRSGAAANTASIFEIQNIGGASTTFSISGDGKVIIGSNALVSGGDILPGKIEFLTDDLYHTGTTGTKRKVIRDYAYLAIVGALTLTGEHEFIDCTTGTFAVTLPTAVGYNKQYTIYNSGTGVITLNTTSAQTISGVASGVLSLVQHDTLMVRSNGTNWYKIN